MGESVAREGRFCPVCGEYAIRRMSLEGEHGCFVCLSCGREESLRVLPLYVITGASGVGKSSIIAPLRQLLPELPVLDKDQMWARDWDMAFNNVFRIASGLAQQGRASVLVGTVIPEHIEDLSDRSMVDPVIYANLHCDDARRRERLLQRRTWDIPDEAFITRHERFAHWLLDHAATAFDPPMPTFDTTNIDPEDVANDIAAWLRANEEARLSRHHTE